MQLYKLDYQQNFNNPKANHWEIQDLILGNLNLIVGKNAVGKTMTIRVINNFSKMISDPAIKLLNGEYNLEFICKNNNEERFVYKNKIENQQVVEEKIIINNRDVKLDRTSSQTKLYSAISDEFVVINPPADKLTLHIRRDEKEYPFFEKLIQWAENTKGFYFGNTRPDFIEIPKELDKLESLNVVPSVLGKMTDSEIRQVIQDFNKMGYSLKKVKTTFIPKLTAAVKMLLFSEKNLKFDIPQFNLSQGMFRAFSLLAIIHHILSSKNKQTTILVDDLGEGLDYDRSTKLTKLLFKKLKNSKVQFIATSNDRFLMNAVELKYWNILNRDKSTVKALNYQNSKEIFDEFSLTGLNNFDLLSSGFLNRKKI